MKPISKISIIVFLEAILISSCIGPKFAPKTQPTIVMETAIALVQTAVVEMQTTIPTVNPHPPTMPAITYTVTPPDSASIPYSTSIPLEAYEKSMEYAMTTAQKIYSQYPHFDKASYHSGEYSGCIETHNFGNHVRYPVLLPFNEVDTDFKKYFQDEKWELTEATIGFSKARVTTYNAYRLTTKDIPALENLQVILADFAPEDKNNSIDVSISLVHIENKDDFRYPIKSNCVLDHWIWHSLYK